MSALTKLRWKESDLKPEPVPQPDELPGEASQSEANHGGEGQANELHRDAERLEILGRLAAGVAHDFNNLLTGILLYCDLLTANLEPGARGRRYAEEIRDAAVQATGLVKQLLAVARPAKPDPQPLSLNEVAEGMRKLLLRLIGENIDLRYNLDPNLGLVKMDPSNAQQILLNLVLNARDAIPCGGQISVSTSNCRMQILGAPAIKANTASLHQDEVTRTELKSSETNSSDDDVPMLPCALFVVRDNGMGMDAATREHLFEAFFTTKPGGKGTGLGLSTVHDIVTGSGGLIHVDSMPGSGTRFSVLLPLVPEAVWPSTSVAPEKHDHTQDRGGFSEEKTGVKP